VSAGPEIGAVYVSCRWRNARRTRWQWKIVALTPYGTNDYWELARIGGNRTRRGNLLRTTAELNDPKKWQRVEAAEDTSGQGQLVPFAEGAL
jgi:hypothetical protein